MGLKYAESPTLNVNISGLGIPSATLGNALTYKRTPTVMGLHFSPCFSDANSLTLAARALYAKVRAKNSGGYNYEAQDLMFYQIQTASLAAVFSWFVRLYGVLSLYSERNRGFPVDLIVGMGLTQDVANKLQAIKPQLYA